MLSGLTPNEGLLFYLCKYLNCCIQVFFKCKIQILFARLGIHYENMGKMSSKKFLEQELVPGVIASLLKNTTQLDSTIKVIQEQYFGNVDYGDARHFVPRFSQVNTTCKFVFHILLSPFHILI